MPLQLRRPLTFIDIEATGTNIATDRIVEIALVKIFPDGRRESVALRFNPQIPIPIESSLIHGIYDQDIKDSPSFAEQAPVILEWLEDSDLAGYNSNRYDIPILTEELMRAGIDFDLGGRKCIDVYRIFSLMEKRDLTSAYKFYCQKELLKAHSAEADILATLEVLEAQLERYSDLKREVDYLHDFSQEGDYVDLGRRMVYIDGEPVFNFGKHKGKKVADVFRFEPQYFDWILNNDFMLHTKFKLREIKTRLKNEPRKHENI